MKGVVLCAGFGTRLAPLTDRIPKPLMPVANRPVLDLVLDRLAAAGIDEVGVNLHHKSDQLLAHLRIRPALPRIRTAVEPSILDTAGGIANFRDFDDDLLVHNADIVTNVDVRAVIEEHERTGADVTIALVDDPRFNAVRIDADGRVLGIHGDGPGDRLTLCGVYALSRRFLRRLEPGRKASVIEAFRAQMDEIPGSVRGMRPPPGTYWRDLGAPSSYLDLHREILGGHAPPLLGLAVPPDGILVAPDATIARGARLEGCVAVGSACTLGRDVHLADCVVLPGTRLSDGFEAGRAVILEDLVIAA